eukprot:3467136-Amphidinium_carterae.1
MKTWESSILYVAAVQEMLGIKGFMKSAAQAERFAVFTMDCADAAPNTSTWTEILKRTADGQLHTTPLQRAWQARLSWLLELAWKEKHGDQ